MNYTLLYILLNFLLTEWQLTQQYSLLLPLLPSLTQIRNPLAWFHPALCQPWCAVREKRPSNMISALFTSSWSPTSSGDSFVAGKLLESMTKRLNFQKIVSWRSLKTMWLFHFYFWILLFLSKIFLSHNQAPVVQKVDNTIHWVNLYSVDNAIGFPNTYSLDCVLSNG